MALPRAKSELLIPLMQALSDIVAIDISFLFSYWLRFYSPLTSVFPVVKGFPSLGVYVFSSWVVILVWLLIFRALSLYGTRRNAGPVDELYLVVKGVTLGMLIVMAVAFFYRGFSYSRLVFLLIWATSIIFLSVGRILLLYLERRLHRMGTGLVKGAIVGTSKWGERLHEKVHGHPGLGIQIVGRIGKSASPEHGIPLLGEKEEIAKIVEREGISVLFLALDDSETGELFLLMNECSGLDVKFYLIPSALEMMTSRIRVEEVEGIPVLKIKDVAMSSWNYVFKRVFDLCLSFLTLVLLLPVFAVVAAAIVMDSRGSVFYGQKRVGIDGKTFALVKFRTMSEDAEKETGPVWATRGDSRVTRVGRFLRRTSLDELPQLWNVLKGDMSVVGPRPERPYFVEKFRANIPKYLERHRVKSGMTGWAQVHGLRGNVPIEDRTQYDLFYVENWSFLLDIRILLMTVRAVIRGENAC
jgi:exopolysaccharide biosynthesis polyprenyl glycosylphosphotransferase